MTDNGSYRNPVDKAVRILAYLVDHAQGGVGVRELGRGTGINPATTHRTLSDLESLNLVQVDDDNHLYSLGPEFVRLATKFVLTASYARSAEPVLQQLTATTDETSYLCTLDRKSLRFMFVATVPSSREIRHVVPLYEWLDLTHAASGLAVYSGVPTPLVEQAEREIRKREGVQSGKEWCVEVAEATKRGYARTIGRRVPGAVSIASPVASPVTPCSIGITAPASRVNRKTEAAICRAVTTAAEQLSLLWSGHPLAESIPAAEGRGLS